MTNGTLKGTSLIPLLENAMRSAIRGRIVFTNNDNVKTLFWENQTITGSASNDPCDYLGQYLINEGYLNVEQFNRAYQTQLETDVRMAQVLQLIGLAPVDTLREMIITKTIDTLFLVSSWQDGSWKIDEKYPSSASGIEIRLSLVNLANALSKRQSEYLRIIEMLRVIGDRPTVNILDRDLAKLKKMDQQIVNLLFVGKTLREILRLVPAHSYVTLRHLLALYDAGVIQQGRGAPFDEGEMFLLLLKTSGATAPQDVTPCTEEDAAKIYRAACEAMEKKSYAKAIVHFRALTAFNPHNIVFKDALNNAEYHYILHFYKEILPPTGRIRKGVGIGAIDDPIEKKILSLMGEAIFSVRDIVAYLADQVPESRTLTAIERLLTRKYLVEVK